MIRRAKIEDKSILEEIHDGEPPWENFEVYLKAIRNSGGRYFFTKIRERLSFCRSMEKPTFTFSGCEKDVGVEE